MEGCFMTFTFLIKIMASLPVGIMSVKRNRGQILDRPEWRMIPELTICFILFALFYLGSSILPYYFKEIEKPKEWESVIVLFISGVIILYKFLLSDRIWEKVNSDDSSQEKMAYHKELFGYLSYTFIYVSFFFLFLTLIEFLLFHFDLSDFFDQMFLNTDPKTAEKTIYDWELLEMRLVSVIGFEFTLYQMLENFKISDVKIKKNRISNIKEYLAEKSVKN